MLQGILQEYARIFAKTVSCKNSFFVSCKDFSFVFKFLQDSCNKYPSKDFQFYTINSRISANKSLQDLATIFLARFSALSLQGFARHCKKCLLQDIATFLQDLLQTLFVATYFTICLQGLLSQTILCKVLANKFPCKILQESLQGFFQ